MTTPAATAPVPRLLDPERASDHLDTLRRAALRLTRSPHDADDLVQEAFAKVLARPRVIREGGDLGYLMQAVRNTHLSWWRSAERRDCTVVEPEVLERLIPAIGDPHATAVVNEVVEGIAALPGHQREVVAAVDVAGYSYAEAAERLGIPIGTVMSRLHRARAALAA